MYQITFIYYRIKINARVRIYLLTIVKISIFKQKQRLLVMCKADDVRTKRTMYVYNVRRTFKFNKY